LILEFEEQIKEQIKVQIMVKAEAEPTEIASEALTPLFSRF
jgi:hypothetical protein